MNAAVELEIATEPRAKLESVDQIKAYVFAGHATFTLVSRKTGARFTYRVTRAPGEDNGRPWFVAVLSGPDNAEDYSYLGCLWPTASSPHYKHGRKSHIEPEAPSAKGAAWFFGALEAGGLNLAQVEVWHEGRCGRCGRVLTVPESVATGLGPVCAGR